jgi:hypothetical protein
VVAKRPVLCQDYGVRSVVDGVVAQLVERLVRNEKVRGSTPLGSTIQKQPEEPGFFAPPA